MFNSGRQSQQPVPFSVYLADERCISAIATNLQAFLLSCEAGQPDYQCWYFVFDNLPVNVVESIRFAQDSDLAKQFDLAKKSMKPVLQLPQVDQSDMSAILKKAMTPEFNGWVELAFAHACYELFENKGELKPAIIEVLRTAGVEGQWLDEINSEMKWAILCSYLMNVLYSPVMTDDENIQVNLKHIFLYCLQNGVTANRALIEGMKFVGVSNAHILQIQNKRILGDSIYGLIENDISALNKVVRPVMLTFGEQDICNAKDVVASVLKLDLTKCVKHAASILHEVLLREELIERALNDYNFLNAQCEYRSILNYIHSKQFNPQKDLTTNYHRIKEVLLEVYTENELRVGGVVIEDDAPAVFTDEIRASFILGAVIAALTNWYFVHLSLPAFTELDKYVLRNILPKQIEIALKESLNDSMAMLSLVAEKIRLNQIRDEFLGLGLLVFVAKNTAFNAKKNLFIRHGIHQSPFVLLTDRGEESSLDIFVNKLVIEDFTGHFSPGVSEFIHSLTRVERDAIADIYRALFSHYARQGEVALKNFRSLIYRVTRKEVEQALLNLRKNNVIKHFIEALNALALIKCGDESLQKRKDTYILNLLGSLSGYESALPSSDIFIQLTETCKESARSLRAELSAIKLVAKVDKVSQQHDAPLRDEHHSNESVPDDDDNSWEIIDIDPSEEVPQPSSEVTQSLSSDVAKSSFKKWLPTLLITAAFVLGLAALIVGAIFTAAIIVVPAVIATKIVISCFVAGGVLTLGGSFFGVNIIYKAFSQRSNSAGERFQSTDARVGAVIPGGRGSGVEASQAPLAQETPGNFQKTEYAAGQTPSLDGGSERRFKY